MTTATATRHYTMNDLLAMPDDLKKRWIIDGELHEEDMTRRNRFHSIAMANLSGELYIWRANQPLPHGNIVCGEAAVQFTDDDTSGFGVDIAYVSADVMVRQTDEHTIIVGIPKLIVEILSPSTLIEDLHEKIDTYLEAGVPLVWVVDPHNRHVTIYQPNDEDSLVNVHQDLTGGNVLPGFAVPVARLFE
jgi:Uma2 family endonuclease